MLRRAGRPAPGSDIRTLVVAGVLAALLLASAGRAAAQSPLWTAGLVVQPFPSPFLADWERNPQMALLTLLYTGSTPQSYHIEGFVRSADRGELVRVSSPPLSVGFGPVSQVFTGADVLEWQTISRNRQYTDVALRTGVMPEGPLEMCAAVISAAGAQLAQACSDFTVALPEPPQLLFPANGSVVTGVLPVLQWTPVLLPPGVGVSYHVKVVKLQPQQAPATALAANPAWFETDVDGPPMLVYPADALPLDPTAQYVWQVEVRDGDGRPVTRGGRGSEIWSFSVGGPSRDDPTVASGALPDTLELVPGVARLTGLAGADATSTPFAYQLNGRVNLEIESPFRATIRVDARDLEIDRSALAGGIAVVRSGSVSGSIPSTAVPASVGAGAVTFTTISYAPATGLTLGGQLALPGTTPVDLSGTARLTAGGVFGELTSEGGAGTPLFAYGQDPVRLRVNAVRVTLPTGAVTLDGGVELFARDLGCGNVTARVSDAGQLTANAACTPTTPLSLGGPGARAQVALRSVSGALTVDLASGALAYDLTASAALALDVDAAGRAGANCGGALTLHVKDGQVTADGFAPRCDAGEGQSDLGWLDARLSSLALHRFAYTAGQGFDFELAVDLAPWLPSVPGLQLPSLQAVLITRNGLAIPAIDVAITQPPFTLAGFGVRVTHVRLPAFTLSWSDWQAHSPGGFHFSFDAEVTLPQLPPGAPTCLTAQPFVLTGAELADGKFRMTLAERRFTPACGLTLTAPSAGVGAGSGSGATAGGAGATGPGTTGAGSATGGASAGSRPDEWADPFSPVAERDSPLSQPPLVEARDRWPADPAQARQQFEAERGRLVVMNDSLRAALNDPRCSDACVDAIRQRRQAREDSLTAAWTNRDIGELQARSARCLGAERQRQLAGGAETDSSAAALQQCIGSAFAEADSIIRNVVRLRVDSSASTCMVTGSYYTRLALGLERQRQLLGAGDDNGASSAAAALEDVAGPCQRAMERQLAQTCAARPTLRMVQNDVSIVLGFERQRELLGATDTTANALQALPDANNCPLNTQPIAPSGTSASSGRAPPGGLAWSGVPPLDGPGLGAAPLAGESAEPAEPGGADAAPAPGPSIGPGDVPAPSDARAAIRDGAAGAASAASTGPAASVEPRRSAAPDTGTAAGPAGEGVRLEIERIGGELVVGLSPFFMVEKVPEIDGNVILPSIFQCPDSAARRQPMVTKLRFGPHGEVNGTVMGLAPSCPFDLAAVRVTVNEASLTFSTAQGSQSAVLRARATAQFTLSGDSVRGTGGVAVDLLHGRLLSGSLAFQGPFRFDLPRQSTVLSFVIESAALDSAGIHIDGRSQLALGDSGQAIGATFDHVTINPLTIGLTGGRVLFDAPFAFEVGIGQGGGLTWRAVPRAAPLTLTSGLRVDLPTRIALDSGGFGVSGDGGARLVFGGRDVDSLSATFSPDFALALGPPGVRSGSVELKRGAVSLATIDALGFHPNLAYFATALLPAHLPLPTESVAYLEMRDANGALRVASENTGNGVRLYTRPGAPIPLVVPALQLGRATAPRVDVSFDVTLDPLGKGIAVGSIGAALSPADRAAFDLSALGLPFAIDTIAYDRGQGGVYRIALGGALTLFGGRQDGGAGGKVLLTIDNTGTLAGNVQLAVGQTVPLVQGSSKVTLAIDSVTGAFRAALATGGLQYDLAVSGALDLLVDSTDHYRAMATLAVSDQGVRATGVRYVGSDTPKFVDLGPVRLGVNNLRVPRLTWSQAQGFQFEILLDAALSFPGLQNLTLPPVKDISLRNDGFTIPAYEIPDLTFGGAGGARVDDTIRIGGLTITPLAFRMGQVAYNWFTGQGPADWGFGFDVEVGLGALGQDAPAALRGLRLRILNAGYRSGRIYGTLEPVRFAQPLDLGLGKLAAVWGSLPAPSGATAPPDTAPVFAAEFTAEIASKLPFCDATVGSGADTIAIYADGSLAGHLTNLTSTCSGSAGPLRFSFQATDLVFSGGPRGRKMELGVQGSVTLPGVDGQPVTANGSLRADLLRGTVIAGRIAIDRPFRWTPPDSNPYLAFDVQHAALDTAGLHFTGGGTFRLGDGGTVGVAFNDLVLGVPTLRLKSGSVTFQSQFALGVRLSDNGGMTFGAMSLNAPRPAGSSFRVVLPSSITIDATGLRVSGSATASLAFGGKEFATLDVGFSNGFAVGFQPVKVAAGRADFVLNGDSIAHIDAGGFWPGNVFGVLPIPQRLGLPTDSIAYVELRDGGGNLLIQSASDPNGLRLSTRPGAAVRLVIPALAHGGAPPTADVSFDIVVDPRTFRVVSGGVSAENTGADGLFSLRDAGVPLVVKRVGYQQAGSQYAFQLSARLDLPASLSSAPLELNDLTLTPQGLTGTAELGTYKDTYDAGLAPVQTVNVGSDLSVEFTGVRVAFGQATDVRLSGALKSDVFAPQGGSPVPLFFTAQLSTAGGLTLSVDPGQLTAPELPILVATFQPQSLGGQPAIQVRASPQEFAVRLSGVLRVPSLSSGLALTVDGLEIGSGGVKVPTMSISTGGQAQQFTLFGATLALQDSVAGGSVVYPAVSGGFANGTLSLSLSGSITFLENTARFYGLTITSKGQVSLAAASLLSQPITIVQNVLTLDQLAVRDNRLRATVGVTLPEPLNANGPQQGFFEVGADGTISGGANLALVNEPAGLNPGSSFQVGVGVATVALRYLGLDLDFSDLRRNSDVTLVADVYLQNSADDRIQFGDVAGGVVQPGLRVGFDGSVQFGNVKLAREFDFDFEAVKLKITSVAFPAQPSGFAVSISGQLSLALSAVTGALDFRDFTVTSRGQVQFSPNGISGGELGIADVVTLSVTGFGYSATPATIQIQGGGMPTAGQKASSSTQSIQVASYVRFGGTLSVADVFSGGVEEFLLYRTPDNLSHLLIRHAALSIQDILSFRADFQYDENPAGFAMVMGAQGSLFDAYQVTLVGAFAKEAALTRAGIFLAVDGLSIPVPGVPVITITGLGGGFFLNPRAEWLDLVRQYAGVSQTAGRKISAPAGAFAIMLYGAASVVSDAMITGRVLLTIQNTAIQIDGAMVVLNQGDRFSGDAHLVIGLQQAYAEGNIGLNIDYGGVIEGTGTLDLFVYSAQNWGIVGQANMKVIAMIDAGGSLFIGPPGFVVALHMKGGYNIWVVSVEGFFDGTAWYKAASNEWGAYMEIGVTASVAGGLASATGTLLGAIVFAQTPFLFAAAELKVQAVGLSWSGIVWVKFENGATASGFGSDPAMQAIIDEAHNVANDMNAAKDQATSSIDSARAVVPAAAALTDQELAQAYNAMQTWSSSDWLLWNITLVMVEMQATVQPGEQDYQGWYANVLKRTGLPGDSAAVAANTAAVASTFAGIEADRPAVMARIAAMSVALAPATPGGQPPTVTNPVTSLNTAAPVTTERVNADGRTEKVVTSGPGFDVDVSSARAAQAALATARAQADNLDLQVRQGIVALEGGLTAVRAATTGTDAAALPAFARHYADVTASAEQQLAAQADLILQRQDWNRGKLSDLYARDTTVTRWIDDKTTALQSQGTSAAFANLMNLASLRTRALSGMSHNAALYNQFVTDSTNTVHNRDQSVRWSYFAAQANSAGHQLWYDVARAGMEAAAAYADTAFPALRTAAGTRLAAIRAAHASLSQSLDGLYEVQAAATGTLYDLYSRYYFWRTGRTWSPPAGTTLTTTTLASRTLVRAGTAAPAPPTADQIADTAFVSSRIQALAQDLTVPRVSGLQVSVVSSDRYTAQLRFSWTAWHPSGTYAYGFADLGGADQPLGNGFLSSGGTAALSSWRFTPDRASTSTATRTFQAEARGGAGFAGFARASYTLSFLAGPSAPVSVSGGTVAADVTPPSAPVVSFTGHVVQLAAEPQVWTSDANTIAVEWSATDEESGVAEYQYALWGTPDGLAPLLSGQRVLLGAPRDSAVIRPFVSAQGRTAVTLDRLGLTAASKVYVAVRARNPGGLWSVVGVSPALRYDPSGPSFAAGAAIVPAARLRMRTLALAEPISPTCQLPLPTLSGKALALWSGNLTQGGSGTGVTPAVSLTLPAAADAESGISAYWYRVSAQPESTYTASGWTQVPAPPALGISGSPLDYRGQFYVSAVALNGAGTPSAPLVYGPFRVSDPSVPTDPSFCAALNGTVDGFALLFSTDSDDPESGFTGYQYRVRTTAGAVARDWPAAGVDWTPGSGPIRATAAIPFVDGQRYIVDVRAVNGQGMTSAPTGSGPMLVDRTPPPTPTGSATYVAPRIRGGTAQIVLAGSAGADAESGLTAVQVAVGSRAGATDVRAWTNLSGVAGGTFAFSYTLTVPALLRGQGYYFQVRSVNGVGATSAVLQVFGGP